MKDAPDIEALHQMEQADLAIEYAERCAAVAPNLSQKSVVPIEKVTEDGSASQ
jgi:hypothetical protein